MVPVELPLGWELRRVLDEPFWIAFRLSAISGLGVDHSLYAICYMFTSQRCLRAVGCHDGIGSRTSINLAAKSTADWIRQSDRNR
jgi:hypothetical protein